MEPDGRGTEEGCGGNEEERELRHLNVCGRDGKSLVHLLLLSHKNVNTLLMCIHVRFVAKASV